MAVLALNDHVLKTTHPGFWTGKLSDFAGLVFFPLLLQGIWETVLATRRRPYRPSLRTWGICAAITVVVFSAIQLFPWAAEAWRHGFGWVQWPFRGFLSLVTGNEWPMPIPVQHTADPTDLMALPAVVLGGLAAKSRANAHQ